jgi:hypothetical protein
MFSIALGCVAIFLLVLSYYLIADTRLFKRELQMKEYEINIKSEIDDNVFTLLDNIITQCFNEYIILNIEYREVEYVDGELEAEITKAVANKVFERISPAFITKLSLIYNTNNFIELLSERVYLHTLEYALRKNQVKK